MLPVGVASGQELPEVEHWPTIEGIPRRHAVVCHALLTVDGSGSASIDSVDGCAKGPEAEVRAGLARWTFAPGRPGAVAVAVRLPAEDDPPVPPPGPPPDSLFLEVLRQVPPDYPAIGTVLPERRCVVDARIGRNGVPVQGWAVDCAAVFEFAAMDAVLRWLWAPTIGPHGAAVEGVTRIGVTFP